MLISIIIPCYRSQNTIANVVAEIKEEFKNHPEYDYQIVLVNDGSPDGTLGVIRDICAEDDKITGVDLSRNYGQASAKLAGLNYVKGDVVVYMDDDGQHDPKGIFMLTEKILSGYDVVYAHFGNKKHSAFKKLTSSLQRKLAVWAGNSPKGIYGSSFLAYSKFAADSLKNYNSPFVSIGGYLMKITSKFANVEMEHRKRFSGSSTYNFKKLFNLWMNTITNFSIAPIRMASYLGIFCAFAGMITLLVIVLRKIFVPNIAVGYTSTIALLLFIGGLIMLILGFLGEYIGRIYMTVSGAPQYQIREVMNDEENK